MHSEINWFLKRTFIRKTLIGACICFLLVVVGTSPFIIKPKYESEAIVYVPLTILSQQLNQQGVGFGGESEIDWYIQVLKSNELGDSLIKKYNVLSSSGNIDTLVYNNTLVYQKLASKVSLEKTRYGSVSIKVKDKNAIIAAYMANEIVRLGDIIKERLLYNNRMASLQIAKKLYEQKAKELKDIEQKLDSLREKSLEQQMKNAFMYEKTMKIFHFELQELVSRKNLYERAKNEFNSSLPKTYVVSKAIPSLQPVYPKRWYLALASVFAYLLLLVIYEVLKRDYSFKD